MKQEPIETFRQVKDSLDKLGERVGLEFNPFCVGWYNDCLENKTFELDYPYHTLAFCVVSIPSFFEKCFLHFLKDRTDNLERLSDPFDQCFMQVFKDIKQQLFPSYEIDIIHDFQLDIKRRPKILVQTAGHVSGTAYYYRRQDVSDDPWGPDKKIYGASCHPKYGGWFGFRGAFIFRKIECPSLLRKEPEDILSRDEKIEFLNGFNFNWKQGAYRDVRNPSCETYSELQKKYFALIPKERFEFLKGYLETVN